MACDYLHDILSPAGLRHAVEESARYLTEAGLHRFDAIAFTGVSGALVAPAVGYLIKKPVIVVRKGEGCHSKHPVESPFTSVSYEPSENAAPPWAGNYVIVDDLVSSGKTVTNIITSINRVHPGAHPLFVLQYFGCFARTESHAGWVLPIYSVEEPLVSDRLPPIREARATRVKQPAYPMYAPLGAQAGEAVFYHD